MFILLYIFKNVFITANISNKLYPILSGKKMEKKENILIKIEKKKKSNKLENKIRIICRCGYNMKKNASN